MIDTDKRTFGDTLSALGLIFGQAVDKPLMRAYWPLLRQLELVAFVAAAHAAGKTLKWFPKPAELLDLAGAGATARKSAAGDAWEMVRLAMDLYDYTHSVDFGPLVNAVVRNLGGWQALCGRTLHDLTFDRKKFEEVYELFSVSRSELRGDPLEGRFGGEPVRIAIAGGPRPRRQLEAPGGAPRNQVVRQLAEDKAIR